MNKSALFRILVGIFIFTGFFLLSCEEDEGILDSFLQPVNETRSKVDGLIEALCDELAEGQEPCELIVGEYEIDSYTVNVREMKKFIMITMKDLSGVTALQMKLKSIDEWMAYGDIYINFPVIEDFYTVEDKVPEKVRFIIDSTNPERGIKTSFMETGMYSVEDPGAPNKVALELNEKGDIIHYSSTLWWENNLVGIQAFGIQSLIINLIADTANETMIGNFALTEGDLDDGDMESVFEDYSLSAVFSRGITEQLLPLFFEESPDIAEACESAEDLLACTISFLECHITDAELPGSPPYPDMYHILMTFIDAMVYINPAYFIKEFEVEGFYGAGDETCPSPSELKGFDELCGMYADGILDNVAYTPAELGALILEP